MNVQSLLDQLLNAGQSALSGNVAQPGAPAKAGTANFGTGLLAGGALGLLLGDKRVRKFGGKALGYGGAAALGALAFRAYSNWQQQATAGTAAAPAPRPSQFLPAPASEGHSRAVLKALIAAAKSDGHIDDRERGLIEQKLGSIAGDPELRRWIDQEVARPLDPADVAAAASSMEVASEMYLVSVLAVDTESFMERAYLDELARKLNLPDDLKTQLETDVQQALAAV